MRKNILRPILVYVIPALFIIFSLWSPGSAQARQDDGLTMNLRRDFGYSSGTGDIQGLFTWSVKDPENLVRVEFYIDEQKIAEVTESPYKIQINTDNYPRGVHVFKAIGYTSDGVRLESKEHKATFVSVDEGWKAAGKIAGPIGAIVLAVIILSTVVPFVFTRGKITQLALGTPRNYGMMGGAVCPKCQRPFVLHLFGLKMITQKFDRCPYCGKWSLVKPLSQDKLRLAEQAELQLGETPAGIQEESEEEKLRKEMEDSRYQGL